MENHAAKVQKNAEVLVYPQKNLTFAPIKEKLRYANEK